MGKTENSLRDAMSALAREDLKGVEHPSTSRLLAYHRGEIPPAEIAAIRNHLALCAECASVVLDAADFFADDEEDEETGPADFEAPWEELRARLGSAEERPPSRTPKPAPSPRRPIFRSLAFSYSLAAIFAAVSISLFFFRGAPPPPQPQVNTALYDLTSADTERGDGEARSSIHFRSPGDSALLILNPAEMPHSPRYGVRILRPDGAVVWRSDDLVPQDQGGFHLSLPAGALPTGSYSIELYGTDGGREIPLGSYLIAIEK